MVEDSNRTGLKVSYPCDAYDHEKQQMGETMLLKIESVYQAISKYRNDANLIEALADRGFKKARKYFLKHSDDELFSSKALVAAAWDEQDPTRKSWTSNDYNGGYSNKHSTARQLCELGFEIKGEQDESEANQSDTSGRLKAIREINIRRGQSKFREVLLDAYENKCAVSNCADTDVLEAAHIEPYSETQTNSIENGILLRADLHTLFDLGLLTIRETNEVEIAEKIQSTEYRSFHRQKIRLPKKPSDQPSPKLLAKHYSFHSG